VELRGLEPLTPTLPGPGEPSEQAKYGTKGAVAAVVGCATVVGVVVRIVVRRRRFSGRMGTQVTTRDSTRKGPAAPVHPDPPICARSTDARHKHIGEHHGQGDGARRDRDPDPPSRVGAVHERARRSWSRTASVTRSRVECDRRGCGARVTAAALAVSAPVAQRVDRVDGVRDVLLDCQSRVGRHRATVSVSADAGMAAQIGKSTTLGLLSH